MPANGDLPSGFDKDAVALHAKAVRSLFSLLEDMCEGAIAVDRQARIVWINQKYRHLLGIDPAEDVLGRDVEEVIPRSLLRDVIETARPILLDIMQFGERSFVVTRLPILTAAGEVDGAVGFVLFDRLDYLKPLMGKFTRLQDELQAARRQLAGQRRAKYSFSQLIGASPAIMEVKRLARRAAQTDQTVLLLGETGTGKELIAQAIHASSPRSAGPFVGVNVAAIPETLVEAELFGVAPGAYTGADKKGRDGKFKIAAGGTLLLDEVGDVPLPIQAKLLRVLEEREFEILGSNTLVRTDVRIIAATSRDLHKLVEEGRFRADLYFRLAVLQIALPSLRERLSDLEALCETLLEQIAMRSASVPRDIEPAALDILAAHDWPGNVRELRNVLERAAMESDHPTIMAADISRIFPHLRRGPLARLPAKAPAPPLRDAVAEIEREAILSALARAGGSKAEAARLLGIARSTLYQRLAALHEASARRT